MSLTVLEIKPIVEKDGVSLRDLTYPSIRYNYDPYVEGLVVMTPEMVMRPDLVSRSAYGVENYWDLILKFNGYSNPFAIDSDDIFLVPSLDDMRSQLAPSGPQNVIAESVRKQYIDTSKKSKQDPRLEAAEKKRREAQRKKAENVGVPSVSNLPPNIAEIGDREIVVKGGKVIFAPDISKGKQACETPLTKSEFIAKLIKSKLKNG